MEACRDSSPRLKEADEWYCYMPLPAHFPVGMVAVVALVVAKDWVYKEESLEVWVWAVDGMFPGLFLQTFGWLSFCLEERLINDTVVGSNDWGNLEEVYIDAVDRRWSVTFS